MALRQTGHVLLALFLFLGSAAVASSSNAFQFVKLQQQLDEPCQPWTVAPRDRCSYVIEHKHSCYPDGGWQAYLRVHFCTFAGHWEYFSLLLLFLAAVLFFFMLLTVSERFFCPALELISEYLRLSPVVAGATLLSFGNGAPDIFTQVAAVGQGGSAAVGMALAEPLGGGLFTTNIVFGLVVFVAAKASNVTIQRWAFLKDILFYLASLLLIAYILADHKVAMWEAAAMGVVYVAYVCATFWISRHDEPVHAAVEYHEVPQQEGVDVPDSCSEAHGEVPEVLIQHIDRSTSMHSYEVDSPVTAVGRTLSSSAFKFSTSPTDAAVLTLHTPAPILRTSSSMHRSVGQLREPFLSPVEEAALANSNSGSGGAAGSAIAVGATTEAALQNESSGTAAGAAVGLSVCTVAPSNTGDVGEAGAATADPARHPAAALPPLSPRGIPSAVHGINPRVLRKHKTFTEGSVQVSIGVQSGEYDPDRTSLLVDSLLSPNYRSARSSPEAGMFSPPCLRSPRSMRTSVASGGEIFSAASRGEAPHVLVPLLQEHHQQEQQELLQKQHDEHLALVELHEEAQATAASKSWATRLKHKMQLPLFQVLSCTMPKVGTGHGHHYQRWRACLLPVTAPLTLFLASPELWYSVGTAGLLYSLACAAVGSAIIYTTYPSSNVPRKALKGVFAVMSFAQAICWLNITASSLVQICVILGIIFGVKPALLGATVLAYGNSVPDLINNLALARDGFPSMAVSACFASPLFMLMVGIGSAFAYGVALNHGSLAAPVDGPLLVMLGFGILNLVKYLVTVPLFYQFKMKRKMAVTDFLFYACFNVVYGLVIAGVVHLPVPKP